MVGAFTSPHGQEATFSGEADVAIEPIERPEGQLAGGAVEFGVVGFRIFLGNASTADPGVLIHRHPQGIFMSDDSTERQKILALAWDDVGTDPIVLSRLSDGTIARNPSSLSA